ncbi:HelD family protein [Paenibacillus thalictri]|uniref:DNA helicase UvrD n=1 Tax=Paenibacillus thalictri TaxID=2527873 RepID=A0A4Q9DTT7_9BACL|nr:ATP-binding domain-containing protein [Paenibacillus thalictri]TBL80328.1 DNA helicase UvrD [Paenibacillus thalictri]
MEPTIQEAYAEESERLEQVMREIDTQLKLLRSTPVYHGHEHTEQVLESIRETKRQQLGAATGEPYFGRLDFQEAGKPNPSPLYIGKVGVDREDNGELLVIDWRAPVASLFYSFTGGMDKAEYDSPEGLIEGLVYLKRNIVIRQQILQRVVDTYNRQGDSLAVTDEFLLYRLGENKDNKLRDIVSTIQAEQDKIIRAAKNTSLIIQGVAGSGKTTVALHRLAFLLYQYREQIRAEKMIIFAPNRMFLDYISGVLPELGVGHIQQTTYADWALELLDHEVKLAEPAARLKTWFAVGPERPAALPDTPIKYKGSTRFMNWLERCMDLFDGSYLPKASFSPWEGKVLAAETIRGWYEVENRHYPPAKRRERVLARIKRWLEMELNKVWEASQKKELKKKSSAKLRDYTKQWTEYSPFSLYRILLTPAERPSWLTEDLLKDLPVTMQEADNSFRKKQIDPEDLAPLLYIRSRLSGIESELLFDHTVIDEAQDFSPFQVALLNLHTRNSSFTILGDLAQGIHSYQGIESWHEFSDLFAEDSRAYFQLERSYRSTMEIIYFANEVLKRSEAETPLAVPVFRSGERVKLVQTTPAGASAAIMSAISDLRHTSDSSQAISTIAVIGRTEAQCAKLHRALTSAGLEPHLIEAGQQSYKGGLSVVPAFLSKGLEFDAVLIVDCDAAHYELTPQDAKLLYVGCTRALHALHIFYSGEPSPLIAGVTGDFVETEAVTASS